MGIQPRSAAEPPNAPSFSRSRRFSMPLSLFVTDYQSQQAPPDLSSFPPRVSRGLRPELEECLVFVGLRPAMCRGRWTARPPFGKGWLPAPIKGSPAHKGTKSTWPAHSSSRVQSRSSRMSSTAPPIGHCSPTAITPLICSPRATRSYANPNSVARSWVSRIRPSSAAHSSTMASGAVDRPLSRMRTISTSGFRRKSPATILASKLWSAASRGTPTACVAAHDEPAGARASRADHPGGFRSLGESQLPSLPAPSGMLRHLPDVAGNR